MPPSLARKLNFFGLLFGLAGVILLFYFGMPFHVPTGGADYIRDSYTNNADIALEHRYMVYGYIGLGCLIAGTVLQMLALLSPESVPHGNNRRVVCLRAFRVAVKFPRPRNFRQGLHCSRWEREMWFIWRQLFGWKSLCPIRFADRWGLVVVMRLAGAPASPDEADDAYPCEYGVITTEGKPDDYRWMDGRIVAVDYGLESEDDAEEQRARFRQLLSDGTAPSRPVRGFTAPESG